MNAGTSSWLRTQSTKLALSACILPLSALALFAAGDAALPKPDSTPLTALQAATFRLKAKETSATCFLIAPPPASGWSNDVVILVTAGHAFEEASGDECLIVMRRQLPDGSFLRKEVPLAIRSAGKPLWVNHPDEDVAALKWTLPAGLTCQPLRFEQCACGDDFTSGRIGLGNQAWIYCFPAQLEANPAGFPILRHGSIASLPLPPLSTNRTFLVDFNTFGGDSGAPVMIWDPNKPQTEPLVVALVLGMERQTDKVTMPLEERTVHHPLGLAIVAHSEIIRQTVQLLLK